MRIGGRLLILLALPLAGLLAVTGFGVYRGAQESQNASDLRARTGVAMTAFSLANELQLQREALVKGEEVSSASRSRVADASEQISENLASLDPATQRLAKTTLRRVVGATGVASTGLGGDAAISTLSPTINSLLTLATASIDPGGAVDAAWASTADNLARAQAASAEEADRLVLLEARQILTPANFQVLVGLAASQRSLLNLAATSAPYEMGLRINRIGHGVAAADEARRSAFVDLDAVDLGTWSSGVVARTDELRGIQDEAAAGANATVDDLASSSRQLLLVAAAAAVVTLLVTILLLRRANRSIARPLAALAAEAEDVAREKLPQAVKAQQDDPDSRAVLPALRAEGAAEVHEVATAFTDIQNTALRLASEQAALRLNQAEALTNLGRRNQTLLVRQLDYISSLETEETDPQFLEHLFKLDHLASRMRRNAESLLILAGSETPRRRRSPAQVAEVVRASMSEVEDFERVRIGHLLDSTLAGPAVIDLIHLLAELIENALGFSPPETTVEIDGAPLGQGGYQFVIIDHGVGMSDVELQAANHRLAGLDEFDGMPTRYLGQYVIAKLAAKIGAHVRLNPTNTGSGVSAIVTLPATAMFGAPDRGSVIGVPRPGSRQARSQGPAPFAPGAAVPHAEGVEVEPVTVPDLRDAHEASLLADDDSDPERWDAVVDTVLGNVVDLSGLESSEEIDPEAQVDTDHNPDQVDYEFRVELAQEDSGVSQSEVAEVFGGRADDGPAEWWTAAEPVADDEATQPVADDLSEPVVPQPLAQPSEPVVPQPSASPSEPTLTPPAFTPSADAPFQEWRVEPATAGPELPAAGPAAGPVASDEGVGSGLLRRRVPGASLAARSTGIGETAPKPVERSADDVRSRLASFQAGRNRGRTIPPTETPNGSDGIQRDPIDQNETTSGSPEGTAGDAAMSQDWRFSK